MCTFLRQGPWLDDPANRRGGLTTKKCTAAPAAATIGRFRLGPGFGYERPALVEVGAGTRSRGQSIPQGAAFASYPARASKPMKHASEALSFSIIWSKYN